MTDTGFNFSFAIGILDPTRQGHGPIVGEHVAIEWVQAGIVDVGDEHAFLQVVEDDEARTATQSTEGLLVQLGPDARTGTKRQQAYRLSAVTECHHEQPCASILTALRVADHWAGTVIDLRLFSRSGDDHGSCCDRLVSAQLANKAFDRSIASAESRLSSQVDGVGLGLSDLTPLKPTPNPVVTCMAGFESGLLRFLLSGRFSGLMLWFSAASSGF